MPQLKRDISQTGAISQLSMIHSAHNSGIVFTEMCERWTEYNAVMYNNAVDFSSDKVGCSDVYMVRNSVAPYKRRCVENVNYLTGQFVDVDCYNCNVTKEKALSRAIEICKEAGIPEPTMGIDSGRGIYLEWLFSKPFYCGSKADNAKLRKVAWTHTQEALIELFQSIGADPKCKDASRVLRLIGSMNSKSQTAVKTIFSGKRLQSPFVLSSILKPVYKPKPKSLSTTVKAPKLPKWQNKAITGKNGITTLLTPLSLNQSRMDDITQLSKLRGGKLNDNRSMAIFYYAVAASSYYFDQRDLIRSVKYFMENYIVLDGKYQVENAGKLLGTLLNRHTETQKNKEAGNYTNFNYKARNKTIINALKITAKEQESLSTIISKDEKARRLIERRRKAGVVSREAYEGNAANRKQKAIQLKAKGIKAKEIADQLSVSIHTVYSWFKN